MMSHHRQFFMDIEAEQVRMEKKTLSPAAKKIYEALDLSPRRDSVETRKTPSPCNSSSFGENSPRIRDSPSTTASMINNYSPTRTPLHHYTLSTPNQYPQSPPNYLSAAYSCQPKRETPSPTDMNVYSKHSQQSCTVTEDITPYMLQAAAVQQLVEWKLTQQQRTPNRESNESSETTSFNTQLSKNVNYPMVAARGGKLSRPFKAYPRDSPSITASFSAADTIMDSESAEKYNIFRQSMLKQIRAANGGSLTISNPKMRRYSTRAMDYKSKSMTENSVNNNNSDSSNGGVKDRAYYERRKQNNAAAKKSRDRRRIKEDELAIRTAFLERENIELKIELASARKQLSMYGVAGSS